MLDHVAHPIRRSLRLTRVLRGNTARDAHCFAAGRVYAFCGVFGPRIRRSWCLGCFAVCLWYESARHELPHIRYESVAGFELQSPATILFASDLHIGLPWTNRAAIELVRATKWVRAGHYFARR